MIVLLTVYKFKKYIMTMNSRGYPKSTRNSNAYNENTLINRNINDNYYPQSTSRNYNTSRELHSGIFTNELNKKDARKKDPELALEIQEVVDYSGNKTRASSKRNLFGRESRDEYYRQAEIGNQESVEDIVKQEMQHVKVQIYQNVSQVIKEQGTKYDKALLELVTQINTALKKKEENFYSLRLDTNHLQEEVAKLNNNFQVFSKENEEKLQTLVNEMATINGAKKSKAYGDYGVDLKNSFQGLNSSISVNLGNQSSNSKLVNEVIFQLDNLKRDLNDNKLQIEEMSLKLNSNIKEPKTSQISSNSKSQLIIKEDVLTLIEKKMREQKRSWKFDEKIESLESKLFSFHEILQKQEQNIFGMNEQLKNTINNQMNPKIKKIQNSLIDIYSKIDPLMFDNQIRQGIAKEINDKLKECRLLKARNCNKSESGRINSITGMNQDKITYKQTYLLDEENYLLDSEGNYLLEDVNGLKSRVKVQQNQLYLLGLKGIEIATCS